MQESDFMDYMDDDEADSVTKGSGREGRKRSSTDSLIGSLESVVLDEVSGPILFPTFFAI